MSATTSVASSSNTTVGSGAPAPFRRLLLLLLLLSVMSFQQVNAISFWDFVKTLPERYERRSFWFYWYMYKQRRRQSRDNNTKNRTNAANCDYSNNDTLHSCPPTPAPRFKNETHNDSSTDIIPMICLDHPEDPACRDLPADHDGISRHERIPTAMPTTAKEQELRPEDMEWFFNCLGHNRDKRFCERPMSEVEREAQRNEMNGGYRFITPEYAHEGDDADDGNSLTIDDDDLRKELGLFLEVDNEEEEEGTRISWEQLEPWSSDVTVEGDQHVESEGEEDEEDDELAALYNTFFGSASRFPTPSPDGSLGGNASGTVGRDEELVDCEIEMTTFPDVHMIQPESPPIRIQPSQSRALIDEEVQFSVSQSFLEDGALNMWLVWTPSSSDTENKKMCDVANQVSWGTTSYYSSKCNTDCFAIVDLFVMDSISPGEQQQDVALPPSCAASDATVDVNVGMIVHFEARLQCACRLPREPGVTHAFDIDDILTGEASGFVTRPAMGEVNREEVLDDGPCLEANINLVQPSEGVELPEAPLLQVISSDGNTVIFEVIQTFKMDAKLNGIGVLYFSADNKIICERSDDVPPGASKYFLGQCRGKFLPWFRVLLLFPQISLQPLNLRLVLASVNPASSFSTSLRFLFTS